MILSLFRFWAFFLTLAFRCSCTYIGMILTRFSVDFWTHTHLHTHVCLLHMLVSDTHTLFIASFFFFHYIGNHLFCRIHSSTFLYLYPDLGICFLLFFIHSFFIFKLKKITVIEFYSKYWDRGKTKIGIYPLVDPWWFLLLWIRQSSVKIQCTCKED